MAAKKSAKAVHVDARGRFEVAKAAHEEATDYRDTCERAYNAASERFAETRAELTDAHEAYIAALDARTGEDLTA